MKTGVVQSRELVRNGNRADASFHLSDAISVKRQIARSPYPCIPIDKVASRIFYGTRAKRIYVQSREHGIPFLSSSDILQADLENVKLASEKYTQQIDTLLLQEGWILISRSGTVGKVAWATKRHAQKLASEDVIRLVPNDILRGGLVYAYLSTSYGYAMLTQGTFGAVIQHIEPQHVASIPIPQFPQAFQDHIDSLIRQSATLREQAQTALDEAVNYFNKKYPIRNTTTKFFEKRKSNVKFSWAAYNNNLEVEEASSAYTSKSIKIGDYTNSIFAPPLFKHIYLNKDNGYPFMTGSELTQQNLRYYRWLSPRGVKDINDYVVQKGTLLLYKSGTTDGGILGNVFIVDDVLNGCCLSDHIIRINFSDNNYAYWAFAFLRSLLGVKILQRLATGTMIPFITADRIKELLIPAPDEKFESVVKSIERYIDLNSQSKHLETEAISLVEQEISSWQ